MITLPGELLAIQSQGHRVRPRLYTRMPVGGGWVEMQVVEATVTFAEPGKFPSRTLDATVLLDTADGRILTESFDEQLVDWAHVPLCPLGSWVKAEQLITRPDQPDNPYVVPWGVYRVDTLDVDELTGSCRFTCTDASQQITDRQLVTLAQGRVKSTDRFQTVMDRMCAEVFTGNIVPWWTGAHLVNLALVVDRAYGGKGTQYDEERMDALATLGAILAAGWRLITPRATNLGVLRLIHPGGGELGTALVVCRHQPGLCRLLGCGRPGRLVQRGAGDVHMVGCRRVRTRDHPAAAHGRAVHRRRRGTTRRGPVRLRHPRLDQRRDTRQDDQCQRRPGSGKTGVRGDRAVDVLVAGYQRADARRSTGSNRATGC